MKLTRNELVNIWNSLNLASKVPGKSIKFGYAIAKNISKVKPEIEAIQEASKSPEEFTEYDKKRRSLCEEYAEIDESGNPKQKNNLYVLDKSRSKEFKEKLDKLKEEYQDALEAENKKNKELEEFMKEEIDLDFHRIPFDSLPDDLTGHLIEPLLPIIEDDE